MMSLLPFWALKVVVALLSMQGQKALGFHQKYLHLCSELEQVQGGWVVSDIIFIFGWTIPLIGRYDMIRLVFSLFVKFCVISKAE